MINCLENDIWKIEASLISYSRRASACLFRSSVYIISEPRQGEKEQKTTFESIAPRDGLEVREAEEKKN